MLLNSKKEVKNGKAFLRKLRRLGRSQIQILSITKTNGITSGMSISYSDAKYSELFDFGDTKEDVLKKAEHIYISDYIQKQHKIK